MDSTTERNAQLEREAAAAAMVEQLEEELMALRAKQEDRPTEERHYLIDTKIRLLAGARMRARL